MESASGRNSTFKKIGIKTHSFRKLINIDKI